MNKNLVIILIGFVVIAGLVTVALQAMFSGSEKVQEEIIAKAEPKAQVLVAADDLPAGTDVDDRNLMWQDWPKDGVFTGAIVKNGDQLPTDVIKGRLKIPLAKGEPIMKNAVVDNAGGDNLAAVLGKGMRAVSIDVDDSQMVSGFVGPGDFVDIIMTYTFNESVSEALDSEDPDIVNYIAENVDRRAAEVVLENVKVLAVDQRSQPDEENRVRTGRTVTLEVTRKGAEIIVLADAVGSLSLALRGIGDTQIVGQTSRGGVTTDTRMITLDQEIYQGLLSLYNRKRAAGQLQGGQNNTGQSGEIMRIYRGGQIEEVQVRPSGSAD